MKIEKEILENALYVVATPIGNLADITIRALRVLNSVDVIICENSRFSDKLLKYYQILPSKILNYNDNSGKKDREQIMHYLQDGKSLALISDAGTPLISDPGYKLISFLRNFGKKIIPIPGPSSVTASLSASGLPCDNFLFVGFLPEGKGKIENFLNTLPSKYSLVFFEAARRVTKTLDIFGKIYKERNICIAKEITKVHEEIVSGKCDEVINFFLSNPDKLKGEFVIIVEKLGDKSSGLNQEDLEKQIKEAIASGVTIKSLAINLAKIHNLNKKDIYNLALNLIK